MIREAAKYLFTAFLLTLGLVPIVTGCSKKVTPPIKAELEEHKDKQGTPQVGGLAMLPAFLCGCFFSFRDEVSKIYIIAAILFAFVGFIDDFLKIRNKSSDGLKSISKLLMQIVSSCIISYMVRNNVGLYQDYPAWIYYLGSVIYISAIINAANIVDGLDSLCIKSTVPPLIFISLTFNEVGHYPLIMASVLLAFLFYNSKKATIFMGDGGSHLVGAVLATSSLLSGRPFVVLISMLVILLDMLSSLIQIISIRVFHKRVFLIAPLHHSFQKKGMSEEKIADRFLSLSCLSTMICSLLL